MTKWKDWLRGVGLFAAMISAWLLLAGIIALAAWLTLRVLGYDPSFGFMLVLGICAIIGLAVYQNAVADLKYTRAKRRKKE